MSKPFIANRSGTTELLYNPWQVAFLEAIDQRTPDGRWAYKTLSLFSGRRGGKTRIGAVAAAKKASIPNTTGWVCAPTYKDLHDFVIPACRMAIPHAWVLDWSEQHYELTLVNQSIVQFRSLDDPEKARGPGLDWGWIDEARKIQERAYETMVPALTDKGGQLIITTSPNSFDWCYRKFWLPAQMGDPGYWAAKYRTRDNPSIDAREIEFSRKTMDPLFFLQEYEADFVNFTGAVYNIEKAILRTPEEIKRLIPEWPKVDTSRTCFVGLDPGADHPFAGVMFVVVPAGIVVVGEYLQRNKPIIEHKRGLMQMLGQYSPNAPFQPERWAIDRSQKQTAIELAQPPFQIFASGAENSVVDGVRRVQSWLGADQLWFIEAKCPRTVEQMRGLRWADNIASDGQARREQVMKIDDDLPDALRYGLMLWPELPRNETRAAKLGRDLDQLPDDVRWQVERMRRIEAKERGEIDEDDELSGLLGPDEGIGDFWGAGDTVDYGGF